MRRVLFASSVVVALTVAATMTMANGASGVVPARFMRGDLPAAPVTAVSGGEVWADLAVTSDGAVASVDLLRTTPPMSDALLASVRDWQFAPARDGAGAVESHVFVAAVFTAPSLLAPTLGEPPRTIAAAPSDVPHPVATQAATYPPNAIGGGSILIEQSIDSTGSVDASRIVVSSPAFDAAATEAARSWIFEPAIRGGRPSPARVYLIFVFRPPVT